MASFLTFHVNMKKIIRGTNPTTISIELAMENADKSGGDKKNAKTFHKNLFNIINHCANG